MTSSGGCRGRLGASVQSGRAVRIDEAPERAAVPVAEKLGKRDVVLEVQSVGSGKAGAWLEKGIPGIVPSATSSPSARSLRRAHAPLG